MRKRGSILWLLAMAACGDEAAIIDATVVDAMDPAVPLACDAGLTQPSCGCIGSAPCVSMDVIEWVDRSPIGPLDGLTVYLVTELDYAEHANPLATAKPDVNGRVVFSDFSAPGGQRVLVVMDDDPGATVDAWTHTTVGPVSPTGITECVSAPALTREHGDTFLTDIGLPPGGGVSLSGGVILELRDTCGQPAEGVGLQTEPQAATYYFSADRQNVIPSSSGTTASGAVLTAGSRYCSPLCLNLGCSCPDPACAPCARVVVA